MKKKKIKQKKKIKKLEKKNKKKKIEEAYEKKDNETIKQTLERIAKKIEELDIAIKLAKLQQLKKTLM